MTDPDLTFEEAMEWVLEKYSEAWERLARGDANPDPDPDPDPPTPEARWQELVEQHEVEGVEEQEALAELMGD